jgi:hypothetical protein
LVGGLLLLHLAFGLILPYILLDPVLAAPGFLQNAAASPGVLRAPVFLFLFGAVVAFAIGVTAYPVLRQYSRRLALCVVALAIANLPLQAIESSMVLSMLSLTERYAAAGAADGAMLQVLAAALESGRRWVHYMQLLTIVSWILVLFAAVWRAALIPRVLGAIGVLTCMLQIVGVPLRGLLGRPLLMEMAIPLAPAYVALGMWLLVKGFEERRT